jgi:hypothetical protein
MIVTKNSLNRVSIFKREMQDLISYTRDLIRDSYRVTFEMDEMGELLLSVFRSNDFFVLKKQGKELIVIRENLLRWVEEKLIPGTVILKIDDEDLIRLLIFCIEITYQMFSGGTRATVTQKGFRERRRTFESILVDQFIGKLGEVIVKKFLENNFNVEIQLDWDISAELSTHYKDIVNSEKKVSIKTSPSLAGIWAEADIGYDYGISVKCSVPKAPILQFFIEVCGFLRLLDFAESKIPQTDIQFQKYISGIKERIIEYKCGHLKTEIKGFICGYFNTRCYSPVEEGTNLPFLGKVREKRFLVPINELKYKKEDWQNFLKDTGLVV